MKVRVLLVQALSTAGASREKVYPLGILILGDILRRLDHDVALLDMNIEQDPFLSLKEKLLDFKPGVVGISLRNIDPLGNQTASLVPHFVTAVRMTAALLPQAHIVAGGAGFSLFPERLMQELPEITYGLVGEAEESFPALLSSLRNPPLLKGLCRRHGNKIEIAGPEQNFDMAGYRSPDRSLLSLSRYRDINTYVPAIGIETKRGCPYKCAYCVYPALQGRRLRCRRASAVVDEMEFLQSEYGIENFHFTDPVLNIPAGHLEAICREILRRKLPIRWDGFLREDRLTEKNIALFESAGCECFSFSPDGLCQEALDVLAKRLDESHILKAAELASKTGVISVYHFMVNVPGETEETFKKSIGFLERIYALHDRNRNLGTVVLNNIRILPGTPIEKLAKELGAIRHGADLLYPTYFNPAPLETMRYQLETMHFSRNTLMWQNIPKDRG